MAKKLPTDMDLLERAEELGVNIYGEDSPSFPGSPIFMKRQAREHEIQRRVLDAERHIREHRLWWVALISAIASVVSAITALVAVFITR